MNSTPGSDASVASSPLYVSLIAGVAALGGLLFGYDTAVINGAITPLTEYFELSEAMKGWAMASGLVGCVIGALVAGVMSDWIGRKRVLLLCAMFFAVSAVGSAVPDRLSIFVLARILGGMGVGAASIISPVYIAEVSPARIRGRLVTVYQLAIVIGIMLIFFVNAGIADLGSDTWNVQYGWRWMFASETLPAVLFFVLLLAVPESPRWLTKENRRSDALSILERINGPSRATKEMEEIKQALQKEQGSIRELFQPGLRFAFMIGVTLAIFSQLTGINVIMYYATDIFQHAGFESNVSYWTNTTVGVVNFSATFIAIWLVDRAGRRFLLLLGNAGMTLCLFTVGLLFFLNMQKGMTTLIFILLFVTFFALSMGPVTWVVLSEIFPNRIRGTATSIATVCLWSTNLLVTLMFPILREWIGSAWTFWTFMTMCLFAFFFVLMSVPETKGKTLEEIEKSWRY